MMKFRTEIEVKQHKTKIEYDTQTLFLGSCFANNIGNKFEKAGLNTMVNPYGVIYNPISIANTLYSILTKKIFAESDLDFHNGLWNSFYHHGSFSGSDKQICLDEINKQNKLSFERLKDSDFIFITFGTSWVYENVETKNIVSNCHKYPATLFNRYRLSVDEIIKSYNNLILELRKINNKAELIFTVSPVRHWKDGAYENQLSKAVLLLAIDSIVKENTKCSYFPAYEIVLDDLRDYRFFNEDMIHPNEIAINYIWEKIQTVFFSMSTFDFIKEMSKLDKAIHHRPFNSTSESYKNFLKGVSVKISELEKKYPKASLNEIKNRLEERLVIN